MRKYKEKQMVKESVCVGVFCDSCGSEADFTDDEFWMVGGGCAVGRVDYTIYINGDDLGERLDLCPDCVSQLIKDIRSGKWKRES